MEEEEVEYGVLRFEGSSSGGVGAEAGEVAHGGLPTEDADRIAAKYQQPAAALGASAGTALGRPGLGGGTALGGGLAGLDRRDNGVGGTASGVSAGTASISSGGAFVSGRLSGDVDDDADFRAGTAGADPGTAGSLGSTTGTLRSDTQAAVASSAAAAQAQPATASSVTQPQLERERPSAIAVQGSGDVGAAPGTGEGGQRG